MLSIRCNSSIKLGRIKKNLEGITKTKPFIIKYQKKMIGKSCNNCS